LSRTHFLPGQFLYSLSRLTFRRHFIRYPCLGRSAWSSIRRTDAASRYTQPRAAQSPSLLVCANLVDHLSFFNALRLHGRHSEIERAIQIVHDRLAREVVCAVREAALEPG